MKNKKLILLAAVISSCISSFFFASCSDEVNNTKKETDGVLITCNISDKQIKDINKKMQDLFNVSRTNSAVSITEGQAMDILSPLIPQGLSIRNQIVNNAELGNLNISADELQLLLNMDDSQLAELAYYIVTVADIDPELYDDGMKKYTGQQLLDCLSTAIGLDAVTGLWGYIDGTATLVSASSAWTIGRALIGRTLGWVGVAYAIYSYVECLNNIQ